MKTSLGLQVLDCSVVGVCKMTGPFKCKVMRIVVTHPVLGDVTVGYVQVLNMELSKKGGVEVYYKSKGHQKGLGKATFRVRRWFMSDADKDLFFDMYNDDVAFSLIGELNLEGWGSKPYIKLTNCEIYKWIPITGVANDIIGEEIIGESSDWEFSEGSELGVEFDEPLDDAYFKVEGEIWFNEETGGYAGFPIYIPDPFSLQGGGYFGSPVACSIQKGQNAIPNPSFETDFAGWMRSHAGDFTIDTVIYHDGVKSCRYEGTDLSGAGPYIKNFPNIAVNVDGCLDTGSIFSLYLKAEFTASSVNFIRINYSDLSKTDINYTATDTNWHEIDILSYAQAGKTIVSIELAFLGDAKKWWIDLIRLIP